MRISVSYAGMRAVVTAAFLQIRYVLGRFVNVEGPINDVVGASDSVVLIGTGYRGFVEQSNISSSGYIRSQDYCAYDYFLQDYVGQSRDIT